MPAQQRKPPDNVWNSAQQRKHEIAGQHGEGGPFFNLSKKYFEGFGNAHTPVLTSRTSYGNPS
jgi:hypothetical protein